MNNKELIKRLHQLPAGQPDAAWLKATREVLVSQITASQPRPVDVLSPEGARWSWEALTMFVGSRTVVRVMAVVVLAAVLLLTSSITNVRANRSLPGDILYPVKITTEKFQLTLTFSPEDKAQLSADFAGRRVDEIQRLTADQGRSAEDKTKQVEQTLRDYRANIADVQTALGELKNDTSKQAKVVGVVTAIQNQVTTYTTTLKDQPENTASDALAANESLTGVTSDIIIERYADDETSVPAADLEQSLMTKSQQTLERLAALQQLTATVSTEINSGKNPANLSVLTIATINQQIAEFSLRLQNINRQFENKQFHTVLELITAANDFISQSEQTLRPAPVVENVPAGEAN